MSTWFLIFTGTSLQAALAYDGNKLGRVCDKCYKKLSRTTFTVQQGQLSRAQQHARTVKRKGVLGVSLE